MKVLAFDMDGTLTPSKENVSDKVLSLLTTLSERYSIFILSGASFAHLKSQFIDLLSDDFDFSKLHISSSCGGSYFRFINSRERVIEVYTERLDPTIKRELIFDLEFHAKINGIWVDKAFGDIIEDRGSSVTYSLLGQAAPIEIKSQCDPLGRKRSLLKSVLAPKYPTLDFRLGGVSSIDITLKGVDKGYGMNRFIYENGLSADDITYFGDRFEEGGNDFPVISTGVKIVPVSGVEETISLLNGYF